MAAKTKTVQIHRAKTHKKLGRHSKYRSADYKKYKGQGK